MMRAMHVLLSSTLAMSLSGRATIAASAAAPPNPCTLVTVAEIEKIVGPLKAAPRATDPATGEITCTFSPRRGLSFVDISLHDGSLADWKRRNGGPNAAPAPEFGSGAFVTPDFEGFAELYAKKGAYILRISVPKGSQSIGIVKAIGQKALPRL